MRTFVNGLRARHRAVRNSDDRGVTLVETVVAMTIMTIFGGIFTGAVVAMSNATGKAEATARSADALNQAFLSLDELVRYASAISVPGVSEAGGTGYWYVELRATHSGTETCTQLRIDTAARQLQERTWTVGDPSSLTTFRPLASGITNGGAAAGSTEQPFVLLPPSGTSTSQQLSVTLTALSVSGSTATTSRSSFGFTAANSTSPTPSGSSCQQAGRP